MQCKELFQLARDYQLKMNEISKAIVLYKEILRLYPQTIESEYAKVQIETFEGITKDERYIILPIPLSESIRQYGGMEYIRVGEKEYKVNVPSGIKLGQKIRLKGIAHLIDPQFKNGNVYLLVSKDTQQLYKVQKDIMVELPINFYTLGQTKSKITKRVNLNEKSFDVEIHSNYKPGQEIIISNVAQQINGGFPGDIICRLIEEKNTNRWRIFGLFDAFKQYKASKFGFKFSLPFLAEFFTEFELKTSKVEMHSNTE